MAEARAVRAAEERAQREAARDNALAIWKAAKPAPDNHPYLAKKGVRNHGLRVHRGTLVIPLRDSTGILHSLQFIDEAGNKRFLSGGRKKACYFAIGKPENCLCMAEGYATAASIYEATGFAVAVAFDTGNLAAVAQALRTKFPQTKIILCADNDTETEGNPGLTKAREAAQKIGGFVCTAEVAHA
jgi:putative DNA primase/helicase